MASSFGQRKTLVFGVLGTIGCLVGWGVGEGFLAATLPVIQRQETTASLVSRPSAIPLSSTTAPQPPAPPLPSLAEIEVEPPALPPLPVVVYGAAVSPPPPPPPPLVGMAQRAAPPPPPEFEERLKEFGAKTGDVQISLLWYNSNDIDLHCVDPSGEEIYFRNPMSQSQGQLDVDKNADCRSVRNPVENIFWPTGKAPAGRYQVYVNHFQRCTGKDPTAFKVNVLAGGERREFAGKISSGDPIRLIHEFTIEGALRLAVPPKVMLVAGTSNQMQVRAALERLRGVVGLRCEGDLRGLSIPNAVIGEDETETTVTLKADPKAEIGRRELLLVGTLDTVRTEQKFLVEIAAPPPMLEIAILPKTKLFVGASSSLRVRIARAGFSTPVSLRCIGELRGLHIGDALVSDGSDQATIDLSADTDAEIGNRELTLIAEGGSLTTRQKFVVHVESVPPRLNLAVSPEVVLNPGTSNSIIVRVSRERFHGAIRMRCKGNSEGLQIPDVELADDKDQISLPLNAEPTATTGAREFRLIAQAGSVTAEAPFRVTLLPLPAVLRISVPDEVALNLKSSNILPVRIGRERFTGPVELSIDSDINGLTGQRVEVPADRDEGELALAASGTASAGRHVLRVQAVSGAVRANAALTLIIHGKPGFPWSLVLAIGAWTGMLAAGLTLALAAGQSWYLSRRFPPWQRVLALVSGGMLAGTVAGAIGQALFSVLAQAEVLPQIGFFIGWALLGGLLGRGIGFFIPNLHGGKAALAGTVGGMLGAVAFIGVSMVGDFLGRGVGAAILGFSIGWVVAIIEAAFRDAWLEVLYGSREMRTVNLGPEPIRIGGSSTCTIWTPGESSVALKFWLNQGRVTREDVAANCTREVGAGHREKIGTVEIIVRTGQRSSAMAELTAPPPPPRKARPPAPPTAGSATSSPAGSAAPSPAPSSTAIPAAQAPVLKRPPPPPPRRVPSNPQPPG